MTARVMSGMRMSTRTTSEGAEVVQGALSGKIAAPAKLMAELAVLSLAEHDWQRGTYNLSDEIVTTKKVSERASGIGYDVQYKVRVRWEPVAAEAAKVTVEVSEERGYVRQKECQQECYKIIEGINRRAPGLARSMKEMPQRTKHGDARWATDDDLEQQEYLSDELDDGQLLLGPHTRKKYIALSAKETLRHAIVCGPTGSKKTSTVFAPNIVKRSGWSAIVTEAVAINENPHLLERTSGYRQKAGHKIYYFNPNDLRSDRINPIDSVKEISDASRLANLLVSNTRLSVDTTSDPFWERNETALLTSLIMHAAMAGGHLGTIRQLIRNGPEALHAVLLKSPSEEARARFNEFMLWTAKTETTRNSIVMGLIQRLEIWTQPKVVALTETTDIDFEALKDELFTFYLAAPGDIEELKPCAALMFSFVLQFVIENKFKHRVALFLDEFANFGLLPDFPSKLSLSLRHTNLPAVLGLQDYVQAERLYKESASLLFSQPATRLYFKPQQLPQAQIISETLGKETYYERRVDSECKIVEDEIGRDLMTPGAVQALDEHYAIVFTPKAPPLRMRLFEVYDHDWATTMPMAERRQLEVDERLVRVCEEAAAETQFQKECQQQPAGPERERTERAAADEHDGEKAREQKKKKEKERTYNEYGDRMPRV